MTTVRRLAAPAALAAVACLFAACSGASGPSWTFAPAAAGSAPQAAPLSRVVTAPAVARGHALAAPAAFLPGRTTAASSNASIVHENLTIVTGDMIGKTEFPAYVPSAIDLPANSTVVITITNFDDATALPKGSEQYARASGILGPVVVQPIDPTNPNGAKGRPYTTTALSPADVSHTFTVAGLGINVPIAAHARVSFTIRTGAAGTYTFRCYDPCGNGPAGWGSAMAAPGYMEGTITVE